MRQGWEVSVSLTIPSTPADRECAQAARGQAVRAEDTRDASDHARKRTFTEERVEGGRAATSSTVAQVATIFPKGEPGPKAS